MSEPYYYAIHWVPNDDEGGTVAVPMLGEDEDMRQFSTEQAAELLGIDVPQLEWALYVYGRCDGVQHTVWIPNRSDETRPSTPLLSDEFEEELVRIRVPFPAGTLISKGQQGE